MGKYPCGKVHILRETIFVDSILREKYPCGKKKFLGGKTRLIAVSVFPEKTQPVLWEKTLPDCVKTSIYVFFFIRYIL